MKFLIVRLSSLGDIVHSLPLVNALRSIYPDSQIDWITGNAGLELLSLLKEINNVYPLNLENIRKIQKEKYDYIIDVQGLFKTGFLSRLCFGKKVIGFKNTREFADIFYDIKIDVGNLFKTNDHIVDLNLKLINFLLDYKSYEVRFLIPQINTPENIQLLSANEHVAVFPSTTWLSKLWPLDFWFELVKELSEDFSVFLLGSSIDKPYLTYLVNKLEENKINFQNYIGQTNIRDLIYILQNVSVVIGPDSGPLHISSALKCDFGKPDVIGIYGPTSIYRNGPYGQISNCLYLRELPCIPCRKKKCPLSHHRCMSDILPDQVLGKVYLKVGSLSVLNS